MNVLLLRDVAAVLLAGGAGERLYPLTRDKAKPAVSFGGQPSPQVTVASGEEVRAVAPPAARSGLVSLALEDSRGRLVVPDAYRYAGPAQIGQVLKLLAGVPST